MVFLMRIERWDPRRDGPLSEASLRNKLETSGYAVIREVLPAGSRVVLASDREQVSAIVSGLLRITLEGESAILGAGDSLHLSPGSPHHAEVLGSAAVVSLHGRRGDT
jgi:quercetin dioxygenase-like cupin family protein